MNLTSAQIIDTMLFADKKVNYDFGEYQLGLAGELNVFSIMKAEGIEFKCRPDMINLIRTICASDKSKTVKVFLLEGVSCNLSLIAKELCHELLS